MNLQLAVEVKRLTNWMKGYYQRWLIHTRYAELQSTTICWSEGLCSGCAGENIRGETTKRLFSEIIKFPEDNRSVFYLVRKLLTQGVASALAQGADSAFVT